MRNIFIEGIQGSGKSTLLNSIITGIPDIHACREGDYSPIELAWCTWMTEKQYAWFIKKYALLWEEIIKNTFQEQDHFIVSYTRIITDIPDFHKEAEKFEVYNGRKSFQDLKEIIFSRYERFSQTGYLFECSFFQNIIEDLILFHQLDDDKIMDFYQELYYKIRKETFLLLYLYSNNLEENIKSIKKERSDSQGREMWYPLMLQYLIHSPYGKEHEYGTFEDMVSHFLHRQQLEMRIIKEIIGTNAIILPAKSWKSEDVISACLSPA